jgi:hypothetical protein
VEEALVAAAIAAGQPVQRSHSAPPAAVLDVKVADMRDVDPDRRIEQGAGKMRGRTHSGRTKHLRLVQPLLRNRNGIAQL